MNFLAHFHLAWPDPGLVAGGLEGDYRKGPVTATSGDPLAHGILLHRAIDAYTDDHPVVRDARGQFPPELRRYAGILIDLSFDHFLTRHWDTHSDIPLPEFARTVYSQLGEAENELSQGALRMARWLAEMDVLTRYDVWESVPASAERIGRRFKRGNPLKDIAPTLDPVAPLLEQAYLDFYPDLADFAAGWRRERLPGGGLPG